ncbi:spermidine/putrescine transport system permease protein [Methylomagnum ishizawai]|uniref:Spermidine/putrescine transport system permease protein PotC n=1 Tax=Methylomagnum ishizawai TaxID=1760988 RepID=A0A1Y6CTI8_9GAMM|nr:spermidine/putrescine ABC transporter permease PotC [Methylomagnum ishizawai]SMF93616.1 spermidine/putrescine transport system permease protein [Methylomagnum ishizawai]
MARAYLALVYGFLYLPMALLVAYSFNPSKYATRWEGWTLDWYRNLALDDGLKQAALHSLTVAGWAASLGTVVGSLGAVGLYRYRFRGRALAQGLLLVGMMSPDIVVGVSLLVLFIALRVELGFWTLLLAHTGFCLPFVVVTVLSRLQGFDRGLIEAAQDLGAGETAALARVVLPLCLPAIAAGWLLSFTLSLDDVVVSFFVTGPEFEVLPLRIYSMVRLGVKPEVNALASLLFALSLLLVSLSQCLLRRGPR